MADGVDHLSGLATFQREFLRLIPLADSATPVPWCGRWRVRNLVVHLARVHHWAAAQARREHETPLGRGPFELEPFYAEQAAELRQTLALLDPEQRAWTLLDDGVPASEHTGTVRFWHRRQALETLIHLWDLATAIGQDPPSASTAWWVDCLDEVATVMHPRQVRLGRSAPPAARLAYLPAETDEPIVLSGGSGTGIDVQLEGPARTLALLTWGRASLDAAEITVRGSREVAAAVLAGGLTP